MTGYHDRNPEQIRARQQTAEPEQSPAREVGGTRSMGVAAPLSRPLLGSSSLGACCNTSTRAALMLTMQHNHGNRAVQRQLSSTPLPIQRMTEAEAVQFIKDGPFGSMYTEEAIDGALAEHKASTLAPTASSWFGSPRPGTGEEPGSYAQGGHNSLGGYEGDGALDSGQGTIWGLPVGVDFLYGGGKFGAWRDGDNTRYGLKMSQGVGKEEINKGGEYSGDFSVLSGGVDANVGDDGFSLGASGNLVEGSVTEGKFGDKNEDGSDLIHEETRRFGLSAGGGLGLRGHWDDSDNDGYREWGYGLDAGPFSVDMKSEDPLRSTINHVPLGHYVTDYMEGGDPEANLSEAAFNMAADTGETIYETGSEIVGGAADYASEKVDAIKEYIPDIEMPSLPSISDLKPQWEW